MNIDGREWKLVPVDPPESAIDDACREHKSGVMCLARQNFVRNWRKTLAAAPAPPVVEVTDDVAKAVLMAFADFPVRLRNAWTGQDMIAAVQSVLGPALGMVTREEMARAVEEAIAAERERACCAIKATDDAASDCDYMLDSDDCIRVIRGELGPDDYSESRKRLEGGK